MSDLFGRKMLYLGGLCTFCIFSIISAVVKVSPVQPRRHHPCAQNPECMHARMTDLIYRTELACVSYVQFVDSDSPSRLPLVLASSASVFATNQHELSRSRPSVSGPHWVLRAARRLLGQ